MTVCVAAMCQWHELDPQGRVIPVIIGAADRMLTAGDLQYEPAQPKIQPLAPTILAMVAGDASPHSVAILNAAKRIRAEKTAVVKRAADIYREELLAYRRQNAEAHILSPLGLTFDSFIEKQSELALSIVDELNVRLRQYELAAEALIVGVDADGPHIYVVRGSGTIVCQDFVGFAAIGIGESHAASHFMFSRYARSWAFPQTLLLTYSAKRRAEVAPGVGTHTDMFYSDMTQHWPILPDHVDRLKVLDDAIRDNLAIVTKRAETSVVQYVTDVIEKAKQTPPPTPASGTLGSSTASCA